MGTGTGRALDEIGYCTGQHRHPHSPLCMKGHSVFWICGGRIERREGMYIVGGVSRKEREERGRVSSLSAEGEGGERACMCCIVTPDIPAL